MHFLERPLPLSTRGTVVVVALAATLVANALALAFESIHYAILSDLDRGKDLSYDEVNSSDIRLAISGGLQSLTYVGAFAAFLPWFYRAYRNLPRLGVSRVRYRFGWAIGAWFVPILNLFRPKQIANDVWRGSAPVAGPKRLEDHPGVPAVIHLWWAAWLLASTLGNVDFRLYWNAETLPEQKTSSVVAICAVVSFMVAAALAIVVVRKVTRRQDEAVRVTLQAGPPVPPGYPMPPQPLGYPVPPGYAPPPGYAGAPVPPAYAPPPGYAGAPVPPGYAPPPAYAPGHPGPPAPAPPATPPDAWLPPAPPGAPARQPPDAPAGEPG